MRTDLYSKVIGAVRTRSVWLWWCSTKHNQLCIVAVQHRHSAKSRPEKNQIIGNCRFSLINLCILLNLLHTLNHNMPKPLKKFLKKRSGIASVRKSRHAKQRSPSPLPSPILESNHSISAPTTPPDSTFQLLTKLLTQKLPLEVQK